MSIYINKEKVLTENDSRIINPNLLVGTKDFTGSKWINLARNDGYIEHEKYKDFSVYNQKRAWLGITQQINCQVGDVYTLSLYVKSDQSMSVTIYWSSDLSDPNSALAPKNNYNFAITDSWQRISATVTVIRSGYFQPRLEQATQNNLLIAGMKLERGSKATEWMPNIDDLATKADLESLQKQIDELKK